MRAKIDAWHSTRYEGPVISCRRGHFGDFEDVFKIKIFHLFFHEGSHLRGGSKKNSVAESRDVEVDVCHRVFHFCSMLFHVFKRSH